MKKTFNTLIKFILFSGISYAYGILNYTIMKKQEWTAIQDLPRSVFFGFPLSPLFVSLFPGFSIRVGNF